MPPKSTNPRPAFKPPRPISRTPSLNNPPASAAPAAPRPKTKPTRTASAPSRTSTTTSGAGSGFSKASSVARAGAVGKRGNVAMPTLSDDDDDLDVDTPDNNGDDLGLDIEDDMNINLDLDMDLDADTSFPPRSHHQAQAQAQPPVIPPQLIARLLHEHFTQTDTRVTKEAMDVLCKYVEVFAQEAIARACFGKDEGGGGGMEGDFLEVEDLEKLVPQLLLDF